MPSPSAAAAEPEPYRIRCAEVWGGTSVKEDDIATPGVRAAIHSSASGADKGGDLYYFSVCAYDTLTRIALADVRGHGSAVSALGEWLYQSLEARMNDDDGAAVLADLNAVVRAKGFEAITTAAVATFHRDRRQLYYASAGHPPLMLAGASGWRTLEVAQAAGPSNLPLGVLKNVVYTQQQVTIEPGDRLFLYSDGVSECPNAREEMYGDRELPVALDRTLPLRLANARDELRDDLAAYAGGALLHDDCTFVFVEPLPPVALWKRRWFPGRRGPAAPPRE